MYNSEEEADKKEKKLVDSGVRKAKVVKAAESVDEDQSYASTFGGSSKKLDGKEIEIELKKRGYDTPYTGIWNRILVTKDGERVGMINTDESYYMKDGKMYKWGGTSDFIGHVESLNEAKVDYDFSERELIRVLRQLKRGASTEIDMIKAFTKALGRDITKDELFSESIDEDKSYVRVSKPRFIKDKRNPNS